MLRSLTAPLKRYARWLHTRWPAGTIERLPETRADGSTAVPGLYIAGDLAGVPLLKFAADTGPRGMTPAGDLQVTADVKEALYEELLAQTRDVPIREGHVERVRRAGGFLEAAVSGAAPVRGLRAIVAIGRSGSFRKLNVPGEDLDKVYNRLHDPMDFRGRK